MILLQLSVDRGKTIGADYVLLILCAERNTRLETPNTYAAEKKKKKDAAALADSELREICLVFQIQKI